MSSDLFRKIIVYMPRILRDPCQGAVLQGKIQLSSTGTEYISLVTQRLNASIGAQHPSREGPHMVHLREVANYHTALEGNLGAPAAGNMHLVDLLHGIPLAWDHPRIPLAQDRPHIH